MPQKNISIEAFRFFFMAILCLWHLLYERGPFNHGYLVVEFFFMLSGALLYKSFLSHPKVGVLDFTLCKFKRFWVEYFLAMLLTLLVYHRGIISQMTTGASDSLEQSFCILLQLTAESFMLRCGIFQYIINHPTWYLSVLLVGGALLYALLRHYHHKAISLFIPILCLLVYGLFFPMGTANSIEQWETINGFSLPLLRGVADMGLGIITYEVLRLKSASIESHSLWLDISSIFCLSVILLLFILPVQKDAFIIIFMPVFIMGLLCRKSC